MPEMNETSDVLNIEPSGPLRGRLRMPGDKSISHRALILGALAQGETHIEGLLEADDIHATQDCLRALGVAIETDGAGRATVKGTEGRLSEPKGELDCGNAGTAMRLLAGVLAGQPFTATLTGDDSLRRRPMDRIIVPLERMGTRIRCARGGYPPLTITGTPGLRAIHHAIPVASAQVKTCLLLAGLFADGLTEIVEPRPSRDHTERLMEAFGCDVETLGNRVSITGGSRLRAAELAVPGDPSAAAFWAVGASITEGSEVVLEGTGVNPTRDGFIHILRQMGADLKLENEREVGGEPVADLRVRSARLRGVTIDPAYVPSTIDEFPALFVAAAVAQGETRLSGASELRVKESDRIGAMARALQALGVEAEERRDGIRIVGGRLAGGDVDAAGDHRCAMALAIAGLVAGGRTQIRGAGRVGTSYPGFMDDLRALFA